MLNFKSPLHSDNFYADFSKEEAFSLFPLKAASIFALAGNGSKKTC